MSSQTGLKPNMTDAEHQKWLEGWSEFMVKMWRERMMQFAPPVYDTGALSRSVQGVIHPGPVTSIEHRFLEYGIYVARGVGNGYRHNNGGDLAFLKDWKSNPHHRQKRDWFSKKYMYSLHRLNEFEAAYYGTTYNGLVSSFLRQLFTGGSSTIDRAVAQL
ncbi:hypothetical protein [Leyella stercorea]|jgi:hypothetical protein|uniref:hypothetical protein n=1 Tax=Leyella stercorea TaxID=363265 RepID=UPI002432F34F|nr:hypothetical protein [Leyella stercorea]